jgi:transcriptional regulator with XRE-family HTH domain
MDAMTREKKDALPLFARNLIKFQDERGMSSAELASRAGMDKGTIDKYRRGVRTPRFGDASKLARVLGRDLGAFDMEEPGPPPPIQAPAVAFNVLANDVDADIRELGRRHAEELNKMHWDRIHAHKAKLKKDRKDK